MPLAATRPEPLIAMVPQGVWKGLANVGQYVVPILCFAGAGVSAWQRKVRKRLIDDVAQSKASDALDGMSWLEFEMLPGELNQRLAVPALRVRPQGRRLSRLRARDVGVGRGRPTDEHRVETGDAAASATVPRVQCAARGVASSTGRAGFLNGPSAFQRRISRAGNSSFRCGVVIVRP